MSWRSLRSQVYRRDEGICQVCRCRVGKRWHVGHLQDRCVGGSDMLENLVLMDVHCNESKPIHRTTAEARAWLRDQQNLALGQAMRDDWRPFYDAMFRKPLTGGRR